MFGIIEIPITYFILAGSALILWVWYDDQRNNGKFRKLGIPFNYHIPLIGGVCSTIRMIRFGFRIILEEDYKKFGRIYGSNIFGTSIINISDPKLLKQILIKDSNCFTDRLNMFASQKPIKDGILSLKGESWRRIRRLLTPTFSGGKLKSMLPLLQGTVATLREVIGAECDAGNEFIFIIKAGAFTMESIAKIMFAIESNAQRDPQDAFLIHAKNIMKFTFTSPYMMLLMIFPPIKHVYRLFNISIIPKSDIDFFCDAVSRTIEERKKNGNAALYHDFLSLMMRAHEQSDGGSPEKALTTDEMLAQALIFFLAGYETSANTFDMLMYFLAANPQKQEKVYEEIQEHLGDDCISYENIRKLEYLGNCMEETGRMHSQVIAINRVTTESITLEDLTFQKGDIINIPTHFIHHDPEFWSDPEVFKPERFKKDHNLIKSIVYLPFGAGPRNCIGMRLAQLEIKMAAAELLREYRFLLGKEVPKNYADIKWASNPVKPARPFLFKVVRRVK